MSDSKNHLLLVCVLIASMLGGCYSTERVAVIEGMSMAPHLYGVHAKLVCGDCGFPAVMRGDQPIENPICPNCGAANPADKLQRLPAPVVKVRQVTAPPQRWNIYAFYVLQPSGEKRITVKRLVGMPDEQLSIGEGDLWQNDKRIVKDWDQQRKLAVLVRDFSFLPAEKSGDQTLPWNFLDQPDSWSIDRGGIRYQANALKDEPNRVEYLNWAGYHTGQPRFTAVPVMNAQPFDPLEAGSLSPVCDLLLETELDSPSCDFRLEWNLFTAPLSVEFLSSQQKLVVRSGDSILHTSNWTSPPRGSKLGCSTFDRHLTIALNDQPLIQIPISYPPATERDQLSRPFALVGRDTDFSLKSMKLYRDIYYVDRSESAGVETAKRTYKLKAEEYFFLGDNPADSIDSRDWNSPGLDRKQIIGSVGGNSTSAINAQQQAGPH